jgi:hypothetical protein
MQQQEKNRAVIACGFCAGRIVKEIVEFSKIKKSMVYRSTRGGATQKDLSW